jgi:holo-[acyl-carrier protein] synthase
MKICSGIDLVYIPRFKKVIDKNGPVNMDNPFIKRVFNLEEIEQIIKRNDPYPGLAGRFAAKEAVIKALSSIKKISELKSIIIEGEIPVVKIRETLKKELEIKDDPEKLNYEQLNDLNISVSISHDGDYATAVSCLLYP